MHSVWHGVGMDELEHLLLDWLIERDKGRESPAWHDTREFVSSYPRFEERQIDQACRRLVDRGRIRGEWDGGSLLPSIARFQHS